MNTYMNQLHKTKLTRGNNEQGKGHKTIREATNNS